MFFLLKPVMLVIRALAIASLTVPPPSDPPQAHASGRDPNRVLVFGAGAARGFGVVSHQLALPGRLADEVARITGRGVDVDLSAQPAATGAAAKKCITRKALVRYDAIVVTLGSNDTLASPRRTAVNIRSLITTLSSASVAGTPIVIAGSPPSYALPGRSRTLNRIAYERTRLSERTTKQICDETDGVSFVALPMTVHPQSNHRQISATYAQWARLIAEDLAPRLDALPTTKLRTARCLNVQSEKLTSRQLELSDLLVAEGGPEERYDRIVGLARRHFDTQFAAFALSDGKHDWFKSKAGFHGDFGLGELSAATIDLGGPLVVANVRNDRRFQQSTLTCGSEIGFYAGYPVEAPDGHRIGVLCVFDEGPRDVKKSDSIMLRDLAMMLQREVWQAASDSDHA